MVDKSVYLHRCFMGLFPSSRSEARHWSSFRPLLPLSEKARSGEENTKHSVQKPRPASDSCGTCNQGNHVDQAPCHHQAQRRHSVANVVPVPPLSSLTLEGGQLHREQQSRLSPAGSKPQEEAVELPPNTSTRASSRAAETFPLKLHCTQLTGPVPPFR